MIRLEKYNSGWISKFESEREIISNSLQNIEDIIHFGSTSVKGSISKPIIDIAIVVKDSQYSIGLIQPLIEIGYNRRVHILPDRICLTKGNPKIINTYIISKNSSTLLNWLSVKKELTKNHELLKEYNNLKSTIVLSGVTDVKNYTLKKSNFIQKIILKNGIHL